MNSETQQASQASKSFPWPAPIPNGGPAFPVSDTVHSTGQVQYGFNGMTLRDYFAGQSILGLALQTDTIDANVAQWAYALADAMLAARERKGGVA